MSFSLSLNLLKNEERKVFFFLKNKECLFWGANRRFCLKGIFNIMKFKCIFKCGSRHNACVATPLCFVYQVT